MEKFITVSNMKKMPLFLMIFNAVQTPREICLSIGKSLWKIATVAVIFHKDQQEKKSAGKL